MAAVGAPEVITQLESAAKVLMVRNSSLFCSHEWRLYACLNVVSGGVWRLFSPRFVSVFVAKCVQVFFFSSPYRRDGNVNDAWRSALLVSIPHKKNKK